MAYYSRGLTVSVRCENCNNPIEVRVVDRERGWGRFCCKSCKAIAQGQDKPKEDTSSLFDKLYGARQRESNPERHLDEGDPI